MFEIIPSPGTQDKDWFSIEKKIELVKPFAKTLHVDVCDGKFAQNTTFLDPKPFKKYADDFLLEVHLMVEDPISYVDEWANAGFRRFIAQIEKMPDQAAFVAKAQLIGEAGLAIDSPTPKENLTVSTLDLDVLLVMMVKAGFSGQAFEEKHAEKIKTFSDDALLPIAVDGGINEKTIGKVFSAGARRFTVTSALFNSADPQAAYERLHEICISLLG